jgi:hypothetical protein
LTELSERENILRDDVSRILRLALLAPDIVEAILAGRGDTGVSVGEAGAVAAGELATAS